MTNFVESKAKHYIKSKTDISGTSRELVISQINAFADKYGNGKLDKLMDALIMEYRKLVMRDQGLQKQYASAILEVRIGFFRFHYNGY